MGEWLGLGLDTAIYTPQWFLTGIVNAAFWAAVWWLLVWRLLLPLLGGAISMWRHRNLLLRTDDEVEKLRIWAEEFKREEALREETMEDARQNLERRQQIAEMPHDRREALRRSHVKERSVVSRCIAAVKTKCLSQAQRWLPYGREHINLNYLRGDSHRTFHGDAEQLDKGHDLMFPAMGVVFGGKQRKGDVPGEDESPAPHGPDDHMELGD